MIVVGALTGMISSLLVFQYGQARIWYAMSRDGLLPKLFSVVHPKYKTPYWSTWIACFAVGIPAGLVDIGDAADLSNIGTLFAFVLVSLGVIFLRRRQPDRPRAFRVPFVPWFPLISVVLCGGLMTGLTVITWLRFFIWLALGSGHLHFLQPASQRVLPEQEQMRFQIEDFRLRLLRLRFMVLSLLRSLVVWRFDPGLAPWAIFFAPLRGSGQTLDSSWEFVIFNPDGIVDRGRNLESSDLKSQSEISI